MAVGSADLVAARCTPSEVRDWVAAAKYLRKLEPSGWIYKAVLAGGSVPRAYTLHRDAEIEKRRLALERSEVDARRAMSPPSADPERPPMAPGKTRAGLPAELQRRWAQKAAK